MKPLPRVFLRDDNPIAILAACKRVAVKAEWSLAQWVEFSASVRSCFSAEALPEEAEAMMAIVRSHFEVITPHNQTNQEHAT